MFAAENPTQVMNESLKVMFRRFLIVVVFGIAFAYIESAVVVYLRAIFYPEGFTFPLSGFAEGTLWKRLLLTEIGREAALVSTDLFVESLGWAVLNPRSSNPRSVPVMIRGLPWRSQRRLSPEWLPRDSSARRHRIPCRDLDQRCAPSCH